MKWKIILLVIIITATSFAYLSLNTPNNINNNEVSNELVKESEITTKENKNHSTTTLPNSKIISELSWVAQSFNNCSSVGLMIALSKWGVVDTQEKIANGTRPWNNPTGNNDDKSVTLYELAEYAKTKHGMLTYVRPNGDIETLKKFISQDIPVLTRTLMYPKDDIVHYRVVYGYDDNKKTINETDGVYGKNKIYSYEEWMHLWKDFNYSYLIIVPNDKKELVESILGEEVSEKTAWQNTKTRAINEFSKDSSNTIINYNLITALYYLGDYEGTVTEFEKIEDKLTRRKLWYQMEPIEAYFKLGKYDRVIELTDKISNDNNKSVSELYVLKGKILESRGDVIGARAEYEKAIYYNKNLQSAKDALARLK